MEITLTPDQLNDRLTKLSGLVSGDLAGDVLSVPSEELVVAMTKRIFVQGKNSDGANIGEYSTTPMYVEKDRFLHKEAFIPQGKAFNTMTNPSKRRTYGLKKEGSAKRSFMRQTMYLVHGYKELREIQDLETNKVNLTYRGDLKQSWTMSKVGQRFVFGFSNYKSGQKQEGLERKYGTIFLPDPAEKGELISGVVFRLNKIIKGTIFEGNVETKIRTA
jgi:hypothetical protein